MISPQPINILLTCSQILWCPFYFIFFVSKISISKEDSFTLCVYLPWFHTYCSCVGYNRIQTIYDLQKKKRLIIIKMDNNVFGWLSSASTTELIGKLPIYKVQKADKVKQCAIILFITIIPSLFFPHYYYCAHYTTTTHIDVTPAIVKMFDKNNENDSNNLKKC